jgi:two-component system phosphate regulon sensor histidine kinase PhoR
LSSSVFLKVLFRLLLATGAALACARLLAPLSFAGICGLLILWCVVMAAWTTLSLRRSLRPLQAAADALIENGMVSVTAAHGDFAGVGSTLAAAANRVQLALKEAAESRRELEALLDSMQDAVISVDAAGRIQWSNHRMQRLIPGPVYAGTVRVGQALVQTVRDPDVLACVQTALDEGTVRVRRATLLSPGRIFEVIASPMPGGGAVAVLHDITRIEQVERTQRDFVANVSHELRTPLTSISGYVETLLDHEHSISGQGREFLSTILKNTARMGRLTEDLLAITQAESVAVKLHPVPVSAETLVQESLANLSGLVQESGAELEQGELTPTLVMADVDSTLQVLGNLIENAIKYGQPKNGGSLRVVVSARLSEDPKAAVEFSVRDFGMGIAYEHLDRIFERFYRVDKARSRASGGTGLGLAIARHIVQAQGGSIRVESEINGGSNFCFSLPVAQQLEG